MGPPSMSFQSFISDSEAVRVYGEWFAVIHILDPNDTPITLTYSRHGTGTGRTAITIGSYTIPAHTPFHDRLIQAPTISQSIWNGKEILSNNFPSFGSAKFDNGDGGLDQYRPINGYTWSGQPIQVYFSDRRHIQDTIGIIFDGKMGDPGFTLSELEVPLLGRESLFNVPLSNRVYRGTSYQLEIFGDRTITFGAAPSKLNITGDFTVKGWIWFDALPSVDRVWYGWLGATTYPFRFVAKTTGAIEMQCTIGGSLVQKIPAAALAIKKPYYFAWVVSGTTPTFYLWDDDAQTLITETLSVFSGARQSAAGGTPSFIIRSGSDATFTPWHDEFQIYNVAQTWAEIERDMFRPLSASIPTTCVFRVGFDDGSGTTVTDLAASPANGAITGAGTSTWLWAMEGDTTLAGTPKPNIWGKRIVKPVLVDPIKFIYQIAGAGSVQSIQSYAGGGAHTMNATYASMRALMVSAAPSAGTATPYLARGYFKLPAAPVFPILALVEGYNGGSLGYVSSAANIARDIVTRFGPKLVDPTDLDTASFTALQSDDSSVTSCVSYTNDPNGTMNALNYVLKGAGAWHGYERGSVLYKVKRYEGPSTVADYDLDHRRIGEDIKPFPPLPIIYEVVVGYRPLDLVLTEEQVTTPPKGTTDWTQWTKSFLEMPSTDSALRAKYPGAASRSVFIETGLYNQVDAKRLADFLLDLLKGQKEGWTVTLDSSGFEMSVDQTVTLTLMLQSGLVRLGLDGSKKYSILSIEDSRQRLEVKLDVWG